MMSCSTSGAPIPMRSRNLRDAGVLTRGVDDELGGHHVQLAVAVHRDADDAVAAAVVDEVAHL